MKRPIVRIASAVVLGEVTAYGLGAGWQTSGGLVSAGKVLLLFACLSAAVVFFAAWKREIRAKLFRACLLAVLFSAGFLRMAGAVTLSPAEQYLSEAGPVSGAVVTGTFASAETKDDRVTLLLEEAEIDRAPAAWPGGAAARTKLGKVRVLADADPAYDLFCPGDALRVCGKLSLFEEPGNPGEFNYRLYYAAFGQRFRLSADEIRAAGDRIGRAVSPVRKAAFRLRREMLRAIGGVFLPEDAGIYRAVLFADKSALDEDTAELFRDGGIGHILAISGTHISILFATLYTFLRRLGMGYGSSGFITSALLLLYGTAVGFTPSVFRAVAMMLCRILASLLGRTYDLLSALMLALLLLAADSPLVILQGGFQLSFIAVGAIGAEAELRQAKKTAELRAAGGKREKTAGPALRGRIFAALFSGIVIQLFLLPVTLWNFFTFPIYGLLLNLAAIPLMSFALGSGLLASGLFEAGCLIARATVPPYVIGKAAAASAGPGHYIFLLYRVLCGAAAVLPGAHFTPGRPDLWKIAVWYLLLAAWFRIRLLKARAGDGAARRGTMRQFLPFLILIPGFFLLFTHPVHGMELTFLDVGQGDSAVLRTRDLVAISDCGSSTTKTVGKMRLDPFLRSEGITRVDLVLASHADEDHINGLRWLFEEDEKIHADVLVLPAAGRGLPKYEALAEAAGKRGTDVVYLARGGEMRRGKLRLTCLHPFRNIPADPDGDRNADSLVFSVRYGDFSALLTGDLEIPEEEKLLQEGEPDLPEHVTVLKVGHHGSGGSSGEAFLRRIRPAAAVISDGKNNRYGHPAPEALQRLRAAGAAVYRTDQSGAVMVHTDGKKAKIRVFRQ